MTVASPPPAPPPAPQSRLSRLNRLRPVVTALFSRPVILTTLAITAITVGVRQLGWLQTLELNAYDQLLRLRPDPGPDSRILTVTITESDIQQQGRWPISDRTLSQLFTRLEQAQARIIGLDLYRDLAVEPGHAELSQQFKTSDRLIAVCKIPEADKPAVLPPPSIPLERVGFADIPIDRDGIVRRNLYYLDQPAGKCVTPVSLGLQLAMAYLAAAGIEPEATEQGLKLKNTLFKPLETRWGAYRNLDARGYQVMLNYRSGSQSTPTVSLTEVLMGKVDPALIRDRIVLVGVSAPSLRDTFLTPFSRGQTENQPMPGVIVHAQMVSQFLSATLDGQPLIWVWPGWAEILWIGGWTWVATVLAWRIRRPLLVAGVELALLGTLTIACWVWFLQSGWLPLVPPVLSILVTTTAMIAYISYRAQQEQQQVLAQVQDQAQAIALLRSMVPSPGAAVVSDNPDASELPTTVLGGRYHITKVLGRGGFGHTFLAEDWQRPGKPICVVKQLRPARQDPQFLQLARRLFVTEAAILEKLGRHKQIPQLLAYVEEQQNFYLVQEYINGQPLNQELIKVLPPAQVVGILKGVLEILAFIHSYNVIHRDIKPDNIIRRRQDQSLVLIDFGAVKQMRPQSDPLENQTVVIGTYGYTPPEQLAGQPVLSSDIYALGMIGIQGITGMRPLDLQKNPQTGEVLWQGYVPVEEKLAAILTKMVRYHFMDRYQSVSEVLKDLAQFPFA